MKDTVTTLQQLKETAQTFVNEREWNMYHSPKNLSMSIAIEAAELMEKFRWTDDQSFNTVNNNRQEIEHELADILLGIICFANVTQIDLSSVFERKLTITKQKYPVAKCKGKAIKYTEL